MEKFKLKFVGRDYLPLEHGKEYEFYKAEAGLFAGDIYIGVISDDGRHIFAHYWRFDITKERALELMKKCDEADAQKLKELNERTV